MKRVFETHYPTTLGSKLVRLQLDISSGSALKNLVPVAIYNFYPIITFAGEAANFPWKIRSYSQQQTDLHA
jgi:hypothetical protein